MSSDPSTPALEPVRFFDHYELVQGWVKGQLRKRGIVDDDLTSEAVFDVERYLERCLASDRGIDDAPDALRNFLSSAARWKTLELLARCGKRTSRSLSIESDARVPVLHAPGASTEERLDARHVLDRIGRLRETLPDAERHALDFLTGEHECDESCTYRRKPVALRVATHRLRARLRTLIPEASDLLPPRGIREPS
ncbi:MAG: hypothetical protein JWM10_4162 [Myxococcaceae bacterium]|nr:hypothetical protein [Myxococcaceae bacterium]